MYRYKGNDEAISQQGHWQLTANYDEVSTMSTAGIWSADWKHAQPKGADYRQWAQLCIKFIIIQ